MGKGGSKALTAIISFILGFIFAIAAEVGLIIGIYIYVMNSKLNDIFSLIGFDNVDDSGNAYINLDTANGGVATINDLLNKLVAMYEGIGAVTLSEVEVLFPAMDGLTGKLYAMLDPFMELDTEELENTQFMDLPVYLGDCVRQIRPAQLLKTMGLSLSIEENEMVWCLLAGAEASYVYENYNDKENSLKYPVYYDEYDYQSEIDTYYRTGSDEPYPSNLDPSVWLTDTGKTDGDGNTIYRQYFYTFSNGEANYSVVTKEEGGEYLFNGGVDDILESSVIYDGHDSPTGYGENYMYFTGNYYYDNDGNEVQVKPVTIGTMMDDPFQPLYSVSVNSIIGDEGLMPDVFRGVSLGEVLDGDVDLDSRTASIHLSSVMDIDPENPILMYLAYNVTMVDGNTGVYAKGTENECAVTFTVENGVVTDMRKEDSTEKIESITIGKLAGQMDALMDNISLGELIDVTDNKILEKLGDTVISEMPDAINNLTIGDVFDEEEIQGNIVLTALKSTTLPNLAEAIDNLTIQILYKDSIYGDNAELQEVYVANVDKNPQSQYTANSDYVYYYYDEDGQLNLAGEKGKLTQEYINQYIAEHDQELPVFYTYGEAQGMWRIMLYKKSSDGSGTETVYTINEFSELMVDCQNNINYSTLYELDNAGVLDKDLDLTKKIGDKEIGEFTLAEFLKYAIDLI